MQCTSVLFTSVILARCRSLVGSQIVRMNRHWKNQKSKKKTSIALNACSNGSALARKHVLNIIQIVLTLSCGSACTVALRLLTYARWANYICVHSARSRMTISASMHSVWGALTANLAYLTLRREAWHLFHLDVACVNLSKPVCSTSLLKS